MKEASEALHGRYEMNWFEGIKVRSRSSKLRLQEHAVGDGMVI